jgi:glycopeptide antibiotics resistance protein
VLNYFGQQIQLSIIVTLASAGIQVLVHALSYRRLNFDVAKRIKTSLWITWATALIFIFTIDRLGIREHSIRSLSFIPFFDSEYANNTPSLIFGKVCFNVVLFAPLGFVLRQSMKWKPTKCAMAGGILSLCVESMQFIGSVGSSATSDVILNTLGSYFGAFGAVLVAHWLGLFQTGNPTGRFWGTKSDVSLHETPLCRLGNGGSHVCGKWASGNRRNARCDRGNRLL